VTNLYLTTVAADAVVTVSGGGGGSQTKWKAGWSAGASSRSVVKHCQNPLVTTVQMTDSATTGESANFVAWYSDPLQAVTITGTVTCSMWNREVATTTNANAAILIERVGGDGTFISTIMAAINDGAGEMATTAGGAAQTVTLAAATVSDTTLVTGNRLRISLWMTSTALTTTTTHYAQYYVNGPTGSAGSSQLAFTETLLPAITVTAVKATGTGTAKNPAATVVENSPPLELSSFGVFAAIGAGDTINSVTITTNTFSSSTLMGAPTYQLWDDSGAPTQIGTDQTGVASTDPAHLDTFVFTGIAYSKLATLRVRIQAHQGAAAKGAIQYVNWTSLNVNYSPAGGTSVLARVAASAAAGSAPPVSTAAGVNAAVATGTGKAQSTAFPRAVVATGTGAAQSSAFPRAVAATGTGAAAATAAPAVNAGTKTRNVNPTFQTNVASWTANNCTLTQSSAQTYPGTVFSGLITPASSISICWIESELQPVTAGKTYLVSAWVYSVAGWAGGVHCGINWYDSGSVYLSSSTGTPITVPAATWTYVTYSFTAPGSAAYATCNPTEAGSPPPTATLYVYNAQLTDFTSPSGSGAALNPAITTTTGAATPTATVATGTGAAQSTAFPLIGVASGTGTGLNPAATSVASVTAGGATGTGTALNPAATSVASVTAGAATGTGAALSSAFPDASAATGTGTAQNATASTVTSGTATAVVATGTGAAQSTAFPLTGAATGTGAAQSATASTTTSGTANATVATGTGTAQSTAFPTAVAATGTGTGQTPAITAIASVTAVVATGAGAAPSSTFPLTGAATGTGAAQNPTAAIVTSGSATAVVATGTGTAQSTAFPLAGVASGTGTAQNAAVTTVTAGTANAGLATGTGTAQSTAFPQVIVATGTGAAQSSAFPRAGIATGTGTALNTAAHAEPKPATGTGTAQGATTAVTVAILATLAQASATAALGNVPKQVSFGLITPGAGNVPASVPGTGSSPRTLVGAGTSASTDAGGQP
jgi:hypothetical protein